MCEASPCGCTVITKWTRAGVLAMIWKDRYYRLTDDGTNIIVGIQFFNRRDFPLLMGFLGVSNDTKGAESAFRAVREVAKALDLIPEGMDLELKTEPWSSKDDGGYHHEIVLRQANSEG